MDLTIVTRPTLTSIDAAKVKANKRLLNASEDSLITGWIEAADDYVARLANASLMEQTLKLRLGAVLTKFSLPRPTIGSPAVPVTITALTVTPEDGSTITVDLSGLIIRVSEMLPVITVPEIVTAYGEDSITEGEMEITYKAGYDDAANVPPAVTQATLLLASHFTTSREAVFMDQRIMNVEKKIQFGVDSLIGAYRIPNADYKLNGGY